MIFPAIKTTVQRDPKIFDRKTWGEIQKKAWGVTMEYWHRFILKKHFTHSGAREYNYDERQGSRGGEDGRTFNQTYTGQKLKKWGHTNPLQLSGKMKQQAMTVMDSRPKGTGGDLVLHVPPYIYYKPYASSPTMPKELTAISQRDIAKLVRILDASITKQAQHIKRST